MKASLTDPFVYSRLDQQVPRDVEDVIIDSAAVTIGLTFSGMESLKSITILPPTVTVIGRGAFFRCSSLASVVIPQSVTSIEERAFAECSSLTSIFIPESVTSIGENAFQNCSSLESVVIPESVTCIADGAFSSCSSLKSVVLPSTITSIGKQAFYECASLRSIEMSESITEIGNEAFLGCVALKGIILPQTVASIGDGAFFKCTSLKLIEIPPKVLSAHVGHGAFVKCPSLQRKGGGEDVVSWLQKRFKEFPLHRWCYQSNMTNASIVPFLEQLSETAMSQDGVGLTALHILLMNHDLEIDKVQDVYKACPHAIKVMDNMGMTPLHEACCNPITSLSILETICVDTSGCHALMTPNKQKELPLELAIKNELSFDVLLYLFERYPINSMKLHSTEEKHKRKLEQLAKHYVLNLSPEALMFFDPLQQHGFVAFVSSAEGETVRIIVGYIKKLWHVQDVRRMASCKSLLGRKAIAIATSRIKTAFLDRLLFLQRYEITKVIHVSSANLLVEALDRKSTEEYRKLLKKFLDNKKKDGSSLSKRDLFEFCHAHGICVDKSKIDWNNETDAELHSNYGSPMSQAELVKLSKTLLENNREVVLKFVDNATHFHHEVNYRETLSLEEPHVVGIRNHYSIDSETGYELSLKGITMNAADMRAYNHVVALPCGSTDLDEMFHHERPSEASIPSITKDIAEAILHIHRKGLIHCDLKHSNVIQLGGRMRLIDLSAATEVDAFAGAKFSSGVVPPEMITRLTTDDDRRRFSDYFRESEESGNEQWDRIKPKVLSSKEYFVVKTFSTTKKTRRMFGGETVDIVPVETENLPYDLVEATSAIDVWSFGVLLYSLHTGSSLFDVDRDGDLSSAAAMKELWEWSEVTKMAKLEKVRNPRAYKLLKKALSKYPEDRYESMEALLRDDYFKTANKEDYFERGLREIHAKSIELINTKQDILTLIENSPNAFCTRISASVVDASESLQVKTPICFVLLPDKIPDDDDCAIKREVEAQGEKALSYMGPMLHTATKYITSPVEAAAEFAKSIFIQDTMYLYLVDEYTLKPVADYETYPLPIHMNFEEAKEFLPLISLVMQACTVGNTNEGFINMFYPTIPETMIPDDLLGLAGQFFEATERHGIIHNGLDPRTVSARDFDLRRFEEVLKENDEGASFSGLRRMIDFKTDKAMWVTEDSANVIEGYNMSGTVNDKAIMEEERLRDEIMELKHVNKLLSATNDRLEEKILYITPDTSRHSRPESALDTSIRSALETSMRSIRSLQLFDLEKESVTTMATLDQYATQPCCCTIS